MALGWNCRSTNFRRKSVKKRTDVDNDVVSDINNDVNCTSQRRGSPRRDRHVVATTGNAVL
jgi:hypothetical protein